MCAGLRDAVAERADEASAEEVGGGMQARIESSVAGRGLISLMVIVTLAAIAVPNLPNSEIRARLTGPVQPYLNATGLNQDWGVFSPNPRSTIVYVESRTDYADGTSSMWSIPAGPGLSAYRDYRWHKFGERLRLDEKEELWRPFAEHVANRARADGREPVRVTLVRRWSDLLPPGPGPDRGPWNEFVFFTVNLGE